MILKLDPLLPIPFIDGTPSRESLQSKIRWIHNGESLLGTTTKESNDGSLNLSGVQIQQNVVHLQLNDIFHNAKINELIDNMNLITGNMEEAADQTVIKTLNNAVKDVTLLKVDSNVIKTDVAEHSVDIGTIKAEIGERDPEKDPKHRTLRDDIIFLKTQIGSYTGYNHDGDSDPLSTGDGMKYKIMQNSKALSTHEARITKIEDDWSLSEVGNLTKTVTNLRNEMGLANMATHDSVYIRLNHLGNQLTDTNTQIDEINSYIGRGGTGSEGSIVLKVDQLSKDFAVIQNAVADTNSGILVRVDNIEKSIGATSAISGSIRGDISQLKRSVVDVKMILGETDEDGMRGDLVTALSDIGDDSDPSSLKGRVLNLENSTRDVMSNLDDVTSTVGDTTGGLVAANVAMGKAIYGDASSTDAFSKDGIRKSLQAVMTAVGTNPTTGVYKLIADLAARVEALESAGKAA